MPKDLNKFGGFLRVVQVMTLLELIVLLILFLVGLLLVFLGTSFFDHFWSMEQGSVKIAVVFTFGGAFLAYRIVKIIKIRSAEIPDKIVKLEFLFLMLCLIWDVTDNLRAVWGNYNNPGWVVALADTAKSAALGVLLYTVFAFYFRFSERVRVYYGSHATTSRYPMVGRLEQFYLKHLSALLKD